MKIKTYLVDSLSEAVEKIKQELGPEAVILSTRKSPSHGKWWQKRGGSLEVTAALDSPAGAEQIAQPLLPSAAPKPGQTMRVFQQIAEEQLNPLRTELAQIRHTLAKLTRPESVTTSTKDEGRPATKFTGTKDELNTKDEGRPFTSFTGTKDEGRPATKFTGTKDEGRRTRDETAVNDVASQRPEGAVVPAPEGSDRPSSLAPPPSSLAPENPLFTICRRLLWHRVQPHIVEALAEACLAGGAAVEARDVQGITDAAAQWLLQQLPAVAPFPLRTRGERILTLVGPTGAGKTTTLVKLASRLALEGRRSLAFITIDHFRIGAEEQLKKYAQILKAPCALAVDNEQLKRAIERFAEVDMILVDTIGRSPADLEGLAALQKNLQVTQPMWRALVVPATLHEPELSHTMQQFLPLGYDHLIMTKLDEAVCYGSLFNATVAHDCPLSYFTMGQQVPEDMEEATKERIVDCLLNLSGHHVLPEIRGMRGTLHSAREELQ